MLQHQFPEPHHRPMTVSFRVTKLIVQRSGTYNPMYYRPYQTSFSRDVADDLTRRIEDQANAGESTAAVMAGLANRIIMPSHQPAGQVAIVNNWDTPRGRFTLVVEMTSSTGSVFEYHIQGYTDHFEISLGGLVDPKTEFYVNSYLKLSKSVIMTPSGMREMHMVTESVQVINGRLQHSQMGGGDLYSMRPMDIFGIMQGETIRSQHLPMEIRQNVNDERHLVNNKNIPSARSNNLPANILSKIVSSYATGQQTENFGIGNEDVYTRSRPYVYEGIIQENPFFRQISNIRGVPDSVSFTLNDLLKFDPGSMSPNVAKFITLNPKALTLVHHTGQTEYWHRPDDRLAWVSSVLATAVPSIMMEMRLTRLSFTANNHDSMGINTVIITGVRDLMERVQQRDDLDAFKMRFIREVMLDITYNNSETYMLTMDVDLFGETIIDLSFGGSPMTRYVMPSFCDSLITPVVSPIEQIPINNAFDFTQILSSVHGIVKSTGINENI